MAQTGGKRQAGQQAARSTRCQGSTVTDLLGVIPFGSVAIFAALPALFFAFPEAVQIDKVMQRQDGSFSLQDAAKEGDLSRDVIHIRVISKGNLSHVPEVPVQC